MTDNYSYCNKCSDKWRTELLDDEGICPSANCQHSAEQDQRIAELETELKQATDSKQEISFRTDMLCQKYDELEEELEEIKQAVIELCKTDYNAAYDLKRDVLAIVGAVE